MSYGSQGSDSYCYEHLHTLFDTHLVKREAVIRTLLYVDNIDGNTSFPSIQVENFEPITFQVTVALV